MKNTVLFNVILDSLIRNVGADKTEAFVRAYGDYLSDEFKTDYTDDELLMKFKAPDGIGIAYTTSEPDDDDSDIFWELQATYDWRTEQMIYTAFDGEYEIVSREDYSIDDVIEYGFDFDAAYHNCNRLTY